MPARVVAVARSSEHSFSKTRGEGITLVEGLGVEGDAHFGRTVQHMSRIRVNPAAPNLRQVHLIHQELLVDLQAKGFAIAAGELGENITTGGVDLLGLPRGARLHLGERAIVEVTGLRNPCGQIERFQAGLLAEVIGRDGDGRIVRRTGVMGIVVAGGHVAPGDSIEVRLPALPHEPLEVV